MQFCSQCGSQVNGNSCSVCGIQVAGYESSLYMQERLRQDSLTELTNMISYFGRIRDLFEEYKRNRELADYFSNPLVGQLRIAVFMVPGIILTAFFGILAFFNASTLVDSHDANSLNSAFNSLFEVWFVFSLFFMAVGIGFIIVSVIRKRINRRRDKERREICSFYESKADEYFEGIRNYYNNYQGYRIALGYCDPEVLVQIRSVIAGGRANTITDAINLLHFEEHNADMRELAELSAEASVMAAAYARRAALR